MPHGKVPPTVRDVIVCELAKARDALAKARDNLPSDAENLENCEYVLRQMEVAARHSIRAGLLTKKAAEMDVQMMDEGRIARVFTDPSMVQIFVRKLEQSEGAVKPKGFHSH